MANAIPKLRLVNALLDAAIGKTGQIGPVGAGAPAGDLAQQVAALEHDVQRLRTQVEAPDLLLVPELEI